MTDNPQGHVFQKQAAGLAFSPFFLPLASCISREKIGYYESVNIISPEDAAILFKAEGHYPKRLKVEAWTSYRDYRNRKYGVLLKYVTLFSPFTRIYSVCQYCDTDGTKGFILSAIRLCIVIVLFYLDTACLPFCLTISSVLRRTRFSPYTQSFHRNGEDWRSNRVILNKEVISPKVLENFVPLLDEVGEDFVARVHKKIKRSGQNKWTTDLSQELFKYALECKAAFYLPLIFKSNL